MYDVILFRLFVIIFVGSSVGNKTKEKSNFNVEYGLKYVSELSEGTRFDISNFQPGPHPKVTYKKAMNGKLYTLLMLDPDAPNATSPVAADWLHLGYVNIPGKDLKIGIDGTETSYDRLKEYARPRPPKGSGPHRYQFLLFQQNEKIDDVPLKSKYTDRARFNRTDFIDTYPLTQVAQTGFVTENK